MSRGSTLVVFDTCVLLQPRLADVVMDLRAERLFFAHWTDEIGLEFLRNMEQVFGIPADRAVKRLNAMKRRCPEWEVVLTSSAFAAVPSGVDMKDRHVAAAALALRQAVESDADEEASSDEVLLVTENVKDFAKRAMKRIGVHVLPPGEFLDEIFMRDPSAAARAVAQAARDLKHPPYSVEELLAAIAANGAKVFARGVSRILGI